MKDLIENSFKKKNYIICTPRLISFGGSFVSLSDFLKIKNLFKFKIILCVPLLNLHKKHKKKKIFALEIIYMIFKQMKWDEKTLTIFFSIYLNLNLFLELLKIRTLLKKFFSINFINKYLPVSIGYDGSSNRNYLNWTSENWKKILSQNVNFQDYAIKDNNFLKKEKCVTVVVKDNNYSQISEISKDTISNIENYKESFNYLISNGFKIIRLGDNLSVNFQFENNFYKDLTKSKNNSLINQYSYYANSEFYFGSMNQSIIATFFDKKKIIVNATSQYSNNTISFSKSNFSIFKKIFSIKEKRILSIEEILNQENLFIDEISLIRKSKDFILIENSAQEILNTCKAFIEYNYHNIKEDETLLDQYLGCRYNVIENLYKKTSPLIKYPSVEKFRYSKVNIPHFFLKKYLFRTKEIDEESKIFSKDLNL